MLKEADKIAAFSFEGIKGKLNSTTEGEALSVASATDSSISLVGNNCLNNVLVSLRMWAAKRLTG